MTCIHNEAGRGAGDKTDVDGLPAPAEGRLTALAEALPDLYLLIDSQGRISDIHSGAEASWCDSPNLMVGRYLNDVMPFRLATELRLGVERVFRERRATTIHYRLEGSLGDSFWEARLRPVQADQVLVIIRNEAERKLDFAVRQERERLWITLQAIADAVIATDENGRVLLLNRRASEITGWLTEEAVGQALTDVFPILDPQTRRPKNSPVDRVLHNGRRLELKQPTILVTREGREVQIEDSASPICQLDGQRIGVVLVFRLIDDSGPNRPAFG